MRRLWKLAWFCAGVILILAGCKNKKSGMEENLNLGQKYLENQEYEEAVIAFTKCIEIDPKCIEAFLGRAEAYAGMEQWEEATSDCRSGIELNGEDPTGYLFLGNMIRDRVLHIAPMTEAEYVDLMGLLWKKRDDKAVESLISEIEELMTTVPSSYFTLDEEGKNKSWPGAREPGGENTLWNGKIRVVDQAETSANEGDLELLYVLEKETEADHFEIQKIFVDGEKNYVLIYYSEWEDYGYKGFGEYQAVLYGDGRIRSVLKGTEDAIRVGDNGLNIDGQKVYDVDGNELFEVSDYWLDGTFYHDLCRIRDKDTSLFGYINSKGEVVIPCKYENARSFEGGAAGVFLGGETPGWGYINTQGEQILDERYSFIGNWVEKGLFCVRDRENGKYGYVDASGEFIIPCIYDDAFPYNPYNGNPGDKNYTAIVFSDGEGTLIDEQGNRVLDEAYEIVKIGYDYSLLAVRNKETELYGYANRRGTIMIPCMYDDVFEFKDGTARVRSGENEFWIDMHNQRTEPTKDLGEMQYEWNYMMGGGQYREGSTYYVVHHKVYNWDGKMLLEGKEGSSIVVIDGTDFYYDDGKHIYVYRYEERDDGEVAEADSGFEKPYTVSISRRGKREP